MKALSYSFILLLLLSACATPKVYTDYDETTDFNRYQRFTFYTNMDTGLDTLDQARLQNALRSTLEEKGFSYSQKADFIVNFYTEVSKENASNRLGISIGTMGAHVGGNIASGIPISSSKRILHTTIEMVNATSNTLYWQGVAETRLKKNTSPEERSQLFKKIAKEVLRDYPPNKK